jgi:hypothetical protein
MTHYRPKPKYALLALKADDHRARKGCHWAISSAARAWSRAIKDGGEYERGHYSGLTH